MYGHAGYQQKEKPIDDSSDCYYCTKKHAPGKMNCPAKDSQCKGCGKKGHWSAKCRSKFTPDRAKAAGKYHPKQHATHAVVCDNDPGSEMQREPATVVIDNVTSDRRSEVFTNVVLPCEAGTKHRATITVKVNTGAGTNVLPVHIYKQMFPSQCTRPDAPGGLLNDNTMLTAYNGSHIPCHGYFMSNATWTPPHGGPMRMSVDKWYVSGISGPAVMGYPLCRKLGVVHVNCSVDTSPASPKKQKLILTTNELQQEFPDRFDGIGRFPGEHHIYTRPEVQPTVHPPRKCPVALRPKVKESLDKMVELGVITQVDIPTEWVNSLTYVHKPDGSLRICLDPRDLNQAIKREHHRNPTVEECAHEFAGSKFFTKLDAKHGYWAVVLDEESSLLTTFNSPFGRFRFCRLPFGLVCSQDIFQRKMDQVLEQCQGAVSIADDITVHGRTAEEHDSRLRAVMTAARKFGIVFNINKCHVRAPAVTFFGCIYDEHGVHPDPKKVEAIHTMKAPTSKSELRIFLGMVTYLSPFIPSLSDLHAPLHGLLKENTECSWNATYQQAFNNIKSAVMTNTTLRYYDARKPVVIQVDASQSGIGAVLLQDGQPVAYASKSLTDVEQRYANIEREMLAVVFGTERFRTYVYGRDFIVESDHKPLEDIFRKSLAQTPARLQRMLLRLQGYDMTIRYRPGSEMMLPDTLSRTRALPDSEIELDVAISHLNVSLSRQDIWRQATQSDPLLRELTRMILDGWPDDIQQIPRALRPYWNHRSILAVEDGLIVKGEAIVVPETEREYSLQQLHAGHQGITKTRLLARDVTWWPGIHSDIERMVAACHTCQRYMPAQPEAPLQVTPVPSRPWQHVATDLFLWDGNEYLVVADYFSKMHFVRKIPTSQANSAKIISILNEIFSEHGIPEKIRLDNGPQFASTQFAEFAREWMFEHETSSPHHPQANGFAEATVKLVKHALIKAKYSGTDPHLALLLLRSTPIDNNIPAPSVLLYNRKIRNNLPLRTATTATTKGAREQLQLRQTLQKEHHDKHASAKAQQPLYAGQSVSVY